MHTSLTLLNHVVAATTGTTKKSGSGFYSIFFLVAIFAVVYVLFLRPARNRQRAAVTARRQVEVGDEVTTTSGLIATVIAVEDDMLTLEVAPGVHCRYVPAAVLRVNGADEEPDDTESTDAELDASTHEVIDEPSDIDQHSTTDQPSVSPAATDSNDDTTDHPDETAPA